jgi:hypothetical protein
MYVHVTVLSGVGGSYVGCWRDKLDIEDFHGVYS